MKSIVMRVNMVIGCGQIGMAAILVLQKRFGNVVEMLVVVPVAAAAGRQVGLKHVFSRAIAAIFPYS